MLANTTQNEISLYIIGCCLKRGIETKQNTIRSSEILSYLSKNSKYEKIISYNKTKKPKHLAPIK